MLGRGGKGFWIPGGLGWAGKLTRKKQVERKQERQEFKNQIKKMRNERTKPKEAGFLTLGTIQTMLATLLAQVVPSFVVFSILCHCPSPRLSSL